MIKKKKGEGKNMMKDFKWNKYAECRMQDFKGDAAQVVCWPVSESGWPWKGTRGMLHAYVYFFHIPWLLIYIIRKKNT